MKGIARLFGYITHSLFMLAELLLTPNVDLDCSCKGFELYEEPCLRNTQLIHTSLTNNQPEECSPATLVH